jgi:membrane-bound ClpP family serine protease
MDPWVWAVLLLVVAMCLVVIEVFVPSGGILAFLTVCAVIAAVVLAFQESAAVGFSVLAAAVVGLPTVFLLGLKWLPETAMGRRVLLQPPTVEEVLPEDAHREALLAQVGCVGRARSKMLPSGIVEIGDRTYDAVGESAIEEGQRVRVIEVRGSRLIVEGLPEEDGTASSEDPLSRPVDWDNLGPLTPPPA